MINFCPNLSSGTVILYYSDFVDLPYILWENWKNSAIPGMGEERSIALQRMIECERYNSNELDLSGLGLTSLPPVLPKAITVLDIHNNQLSEITPALAPTLIKLNASNNQLTFLPDMKFQFELQSLDVSYNHLEVLTGDLPPALKMLNVSNNLLEEIPILPLFLIEFYAHNNNLILFHGELTPTLRILDLRENPRLTRLPTELQQGLHKLFVSGSRPEFKSYGSPLDLKEFYADDSLLMSIFSSRRD
ncbi:hypothetical protein [Acerihabitans sp.]|uniref:hypothetical protein n=1 Tax=Acerihabitans sp. TaxID=2811394 RepID=UPI0019401EBC